MQIIRIKTTVSVLNKNEQTSLKPDSLHIYPKGLSMKLTKIAALVASTSLLIACGSSDSDDVASPESRLLETNAQIAYAVYTDSVNTAKDLQTALATLKETPNADNLTAAKKAWLVAREPYKWTRRRS